MAEQARVAVKLRDGAAVGIKTAPPSGRNASFKFVDDSGNAIIVGMTQHQFNNFVRQTRRVTGWCASVDS